MGQRKQDGAGHHFRVAFAQPFGGQALALNGGGGGGGLTIGTAIDGIQGQVLRTDHRQRGIFPRALAQHRQQFGKGGALFFDAATETLHLRLQQARTQRQQVALAKRGTRIGGSAVQHRLGGIQVAQAEQAHRR